MHHAGYVLHHLNLAQVGVSLLRREPLKQQQEQFTGLFFSLVGFQGGRQRNNNLLCCAIVEEKGGAGGGAGATLRARHQIEHSLAHILNFAGVFLGIKNAPYAVGENRSTGGTGQRNRFAV
jgi:hypothetical protein